MNYDPTKFFYKVLPARCKSGVEVVIVRLETQDVWMTYIANQTVDSPGLHAHMQSLTDDLLLDFFVKGKEARKLEKERQQKAKDERIFKS